MPAQGSRLDLAIEQAVTLLSQAGVNQGQLILMTDSAVRAQDITTAAQVKSAGHRLSVIGVGTERGTPLRGEDGRFLQDASGAVVVPQLDTASLTSLARAGGGVFTTLTSDNTDLQQIDRVQKALAISVDETEKRTSNEYWVEYGPYAVLVLCICALLFFRRGVIW